MPRIGELLARAVQRTGLSDFGEETFQQGLNVLLAAYEENPYLSGAGRRALADQVVDILSYRLETEARLRAADGRLATGVSRPLVIVGLARSGTTALHKLIAQDPAFQSLPYWLGIHPQARPPRSAWSSNRDFQNVSNMLEVLYQRQPEMRAIHDMRADEPDECRHLRVQGFCDFYCENSYVPAYRSWLAAADQGPTYARYAKCLRLIASGDERRWVLKCPGHLFGLGALLAEFPDACVVWTHRAPEQTIPSACSARYAASRAMEPTLPIQTFGRQNLERWTLAVGRAEQARSASDPERFYDADYLRLVDDPIAEVERIYAHFHIELRDETRQAMRAWHAHRPRGEHGHHRYSAEQFGLDNETIRAQFASYRARYGLS